MKVSVKALVLKLWLLIKTDSTYLKNSEPLFWYSNYKEVVESYIKSCENSPKQVDLKLKTNSQLHSIPVPSNVKTTGSRILIVCIDFYREWLDAKPIRTSNHMFGRVIWDKLPERFFENFQKSWGCIIPKISKTKHVDTGKSQQMNARNISNNINYHLQKIRILSSPLTRTSLTLCLSLLM